MYSIDWVRDDEDVCLGGVLRDALDEGVETCCIGSLALASNSAIRQGGRMCRRGIGSEEPRIIASSNVIFGPLGLIDFDGIIACHSRVASGPKMTMLEHRKPGSLAEALVGLDYGIELCYAAVVGSRIVALLIAPSPSRQEVIHSVYLGTVVGWRPGRGMS